MPRRFCVLAVLGRNNALISAASVKCCFLVGVAPASPRSLGVDLVEHATILEMRRLRLGPTAEDIIDRDQIDRLEGSRVFRRDLRSRGR